MPGPTMDIVVVVCSGCREHVDGCLRSLEAVATSSRLVLRVQVIDNASQDGTGELVRSAFGWVEYVRLEENFGFSVASNVGLRRSSGDYVLLLNPDTEVPPDAPDRAVARMEGDPEIGALGCRLVDRAGRPDHNAKRTVPTPGAALRYFAARALGRPSSSAYTTPALPDDAAGEVDAVSGAFMLVRRRALEQVGLLDEGFWMYGEDLDWCARFKQAGWKVFYDGTVTVLHIGAGAAGAHRALRPNVAFHLAMGRYYRRYQSGRSPLVDLAVYAAILARMVVAIVGAAAARRLHRGTS